MIKPPGDDVASVYRKIEVERFSPELKPDHPALRMKVSDLPIGTLVINDQGKEMRTFVGGEAGERQYRINFLARQLQRADDAP